MHVRGGRVFVGNAPVVLGRTGNLRDARRIDGSNLQRKVDLLVCVDIRATTLSAANVAARVFIVVCNANRCDVLEGGEANRKRKHTLSDDCAINCAHPAAEPLCRQSKLPALATRCARMDTQ